MPSPYLRKLSKETGISVSKLEPYWEQAKELATEHFGKLEASFGQKEWDWAMQMVKQLAGIQESRVSVQDFISTDKSVDEFITESLVTSGDFPSLQTNVITKDDEEDEDEDEFDEPVREAKKDGTDPDGTGPHGRGNGPGKGKADGSGMKKDKEEDDEETLQEAGEETGLYIDSPKRIQIMQQWVEKGDKLMINANYEDVDGRYKIEVRIPYTNKTQWAVFPNKAEAKRYGFLPEGV